MENITIDSEAFKILCEKIDMIIDHIMKEKMPDENCNEDEIWIDSSDVCRYLSISDRTLYRLRVEGLISYSVLSGKAFYTLADIKTALKKNVIRGGGEKLNKLISHQSEYLKKGRIGRPKAEMK